MTDKPWSGRFNETTQEVVEKFSESVSIDKRLYREDIEGSIAHARMLASVGLLTKEELASIVGGLSSIKADIESGVFTFNPSLEDVHMNIETELTDRIGEAGKKLHTARSRNDQVATDLRMYIRKEQLNIQTALKNLLHILVAKAQIHMDTIIPGMTHLQHAQGISYAHHLLAYFEMFLRDYERIKDAGKRVNISPLGSAALAGTPHPIDRFMTAESLGFSEPCRNSIDGVSDRDFAIESVFICCLIMMHLSRMAEEIIIWNSQPFAFITLPDGYCTGSSIMPQKKNPDVAELVRGKVGSMYGNLVSLLTMMKGLPLAYNRDMQEDKRPVIESLDTVKDCIEVMTGLIHGITINQDSVKRSLSQGFITATDVADYLAAKGMPFRQAHRITGEIVASLIKQGKTLSECSLNEYKSFSELFEQDIFKAVNPLESVDKKKSYGGTGRDTISSALKVAHDRLEKLDNEP